MAASGGPGGLVQWNNPAAVTAAFPNPPASAVPYLPAAAPPPQQGPTPNPGATAIDPATAAARQAMLDRQQAGSAPTSTYKPPSASPYFPGSVFEAGSPSFSAASTAAKLGGPVVLGS